MVRFNAPPELTRQRRVGSEEGTGKWNEYEFRAFGLKVPHLPLWCLTCNPRCGPPHRSGVLRWDKGCWPPRKAVGLQCCLAGLNPTTVSAGGKFGWIANTLKRDRAAF